MDVNENCAKVFNNPIILEIILKYAEYDLLNLSSRLVNRLFNKIVLKTIRSNHRKMKFEFNEATGETRGLLNEMVHVHHRATRMKHLSGFFRFLNSVAKVKVEEIDIKNVWKLEPELGKQFHDDIHSKLIGENDEIVKKLVGLEEVCNGCSHCLHIANTALEYGPIGLESIQKIDKPFIFEKLVVTDRFLEQVANKCVLDSTWKQNCHEKLNEIINDKITIKTLVLWVSETRRTQEHLDYESMPREVLEMISKKWRMNSIQIRLHYSHQNDICVDEWAQNGYFSKFKVNNSIRSNEQSSEIFSHVEVDLSDSFRCSCDIKFYDPLTLPYRGYQSLLVNILGLFPTDYVSIKCIGARDFAIQWVRDIFKNLLRVVMLTNRKNLTLDVELFIQLYSWESFYRELNEEETVEIPSEYSIQNPTLNCIHREVSRVFTNGDFRFGMLKWVGKRLKMVKEDLNFVLNLDVFFNSNVFYKEYSKDPTHSRSFIRHFKF